MLRFRIRLLGFYHTTIRGMVLAGNKPRHVLKMLTAADVLVTIDGVKKYIYRFKGTWPTAEELGWEDRQRGDVLSGAKAIRKIVVSPKEIKPRTSPLVHDVPAKSFWWNSITLDGVHFFSLTPDGWKSNFSAIREPDADSVGFFQYLSAVRHGCVALPDEALPISSQLKELSSLLASKVRLRVMTDFNPLLKGVCGFNVSFGKRERGMNELQQFQKLPRWWRRKVQVEGTLGGVFLPLGLEWCAETGEAGIFDGTTVALTPDVPEWAFPEEIEFWKRQQGLSDVESLKRWKPVPEEYARLVRDESKITAGLFCKKF